MIVKIKDAIVALIRAAQTGAEDYHLGMLMSLSALIDKPGADWETAELTLTFGQGGYFDTSKVFVYLDNVPLGEVEVEVAATAFCERRVPEVIKR